MKVLLTEKVEKLGNAWDMITVKDGYARNFLFPQNLAMEATKDNLKKREGLMARRSAIEEKERQSSQELAKKLQGASFTVTCEANIDDTLYGSVGVVELSKYLASEGYAIDKNDIVLEEPIKSLGVYEIPIKLHPKVYAKIKVWIVKK